jgi:hypothetical protein
MAFAAAARPQTIDGEQTTSATTHHVLTRDAPRVRVHCKDSQMDVDASRIDVDVLVGDRGAILPTPTTWRTPEPVGRDRKEPPVTSAQSCDQSNAVAASTSAVIRRTHRYARTSNTPLDQRETNPHTRRDGARAAPVGATMIGAILIKQTRVHNGNAVNRPLRRARGVRFVVA